MDKFLYYWENKNKDKHGKNCHDQQKIFSPFVIYVDGVLGKEALIVLTNLSQLMAEEMDEPILHMQGWINVRILMWSRDCNHKWST